MRGSFRRDAEVRPDPEVPGAFALARRPRARTISRAMIALSFAAALLDLWLHRPGLALAQLGLFTAFLLVHLFGEAWMWRFAGDQILVRALELKRLRLRLRVERLHAREILRVGLERRGVRARAWLEMKNGDNYALVEGRAAEVEQIADRVQHALLLARAEPQGQTLH